MGRKIAGMLFVLIGLIIAFKISSGENETDKIQKVMMESLNNSVIAEVENRVDKQLNQDGDEDEKQGGSKIHKQVDLQGLGKAEKEDNTIDEPVKEEERSKKEKVMPEDIKCIGIIEIPKIDLKVAISEGATLENLRYSVAHYTETAAIGGRGNCAIAGHRSYAYNEFFNRLDEIEVGDEIKLSNGKEKFIYEVYDTFVVEPTQVEVLEPCEEAELTLITCTPIRVATHRLIIKAKKL